MDLRKQSSEYFIEHALDLDDIIDFKCKGCGKCCKNRNDLLFTPMDLHRAGQYLGRTVKELTDRYCETYIGDISHFPMARVVPIPPNAACPFQRGSKCVLHHSKPTVCAAFPLARMTGTVEDGSTKYVLNESVSCGSKGYPMTIQEYLGRNYSEEIDQSGREWGQMLREYGELVYPIWHSLPKKAYPYYELELVNLAYYSVDIKKPIVEEIKRIHNLLPTLVRKLFEIPEYEYQEKYESLKRELGIDG